MKKMFAVLLALCMALTCLTMASAEEKTYKDVSRRHFAAGAA